MDVLRITGGAELRGEVRASGSKNAALPIMAASILAGEPVLLERVPKLVDVDTLALLLGHLGVEVKRNAAGTVRLETVDPAPTLADYELVRRMRASFCVLGPLVARRGRAVVSLPGGCNIGTRPVDLHLAGLTALGAEIRIERGYVIATARGLRGATIDLAGPHGPTVTGTANVMSAATLARGRTTITSAAKEPEIVDLGQFLIALGAEIHGLGSDTIEIVGREWLGGATHRVIDDRIEAATLLLAGAIAGGEVRVGGAVAGHLAAVLEVLVAAGVDVECDVDEVSLRSCGRLQPIWAIAGPYPAIPSDVQAQLMAMAAIAGGRSVVGDNVFPNRFQHIDELRRLGARIERRGAECTVDGVGRLSGATVEASDLRASAALVLAALAAEGETTVRRLHHLDRGYERLELKLAHLGAHIRRQRDVAGPRSVGKRSHAAVEREW
ncbi:MAG: UDP-N-acetylglucosamine 1-carboxyvinyltransferase [Pirellulales bacterium]